MKRLLVSVSGGKTSGMMAKKLWDLKRDEFDMSFVFANTGAEDNKTLQFISQMEYYWSMPIIWVESLVEYGVRVGTKFKTVTTITASRNGEPFEDVIKKYGVPNMKFPHCTRELKERPLRAWAKEFIGNNYYTAIGIRVDEADRINVKAREKKFIYPLVSMWPTNKEMVNEWWSKQSFNLDLKSYQGNCKTCWKKSDKKLFRIANETPEAYSFFNRMEEEHGNGYTFFRGNRSTKDILNQAKEAAKQTNLDFDNDLIGGDSCEVYSECGSNN
jgi:hypothetical protein